MSIKESAETFAHDWYARPESGRDEETLAAMLLWWVREQRQAAIDEYRERVLSRFKKVLS